MIFSPSRKLIFIHIPKCGGSSVERAYEDFSLYDDIILGSTKFGQQIDSYFQKKFGLCKHSLPMDIINIVGEQKWIDFKTFALIRNPFSVYESYYRFISGIFIRHSQSENISVTELKKRVLNTETGYPFESWYLAQAYASTHDFEQFFDKMLAYKKFPVSPFSDCLLLNDSLLRVDHVYKLEEINKLWDALDICLSDGKIHRRHSNKSLKKIKIKWAARHTDLILNHHEEDFIRFNYNRQKV